RNLARALIAIGHRAEAETHFAVALHKAPTQTAEILCDWGNALVESGDSGAAIDLFATAVKAAPEFALARNNLANALAQSGRIKEAVIQYKEVLRLDPNYAEAHNNLAN